MSRKEQRKRYKQRYPERIKAEKRRYAQKMRTDCLIAYSGPEPHCSCCGETETKFLSIDHINGGGDAHRREVGFGKSFYQWLRKNKFPPGFQILCHNCNMAKGFYGQCPHKKA